MPNPTLTQSSLSPVLMHRTVLKSALGKAVVPGNPLLASRLSGGNLKLPGGHPADGLHVLLHRLLLPSHGLNAIFLLPRGIESRSTSVVLACSGPKAVSPTFLVIKQCSFLPRSAAGQHQTNRHHQRYPHWRTLPDSLAVLRTVPIMRGMLERGFTTVRDVGGAPVALADAQEQGLIAGPSSSSAARHCPRRVDTPTSGKNTMYVNRIATIIGLDRSAASQTVQRKYVAPAEKSCDKARAS